MHAASARVLIPTPSRYMNRLAKHFEHRVSVTRDDKTATVSFPDAPCTLQATDTHLSIRIEANAAEQIDRLKEVVERHLRQVASQETFDVVWQNT
jgi:uncharacterized protein